jgi:hypothetical protein
MRFGAWNLTMCQDLTESPYTLLGILLKEIYAKCCIGPKKIK